MVFTAGAVAVAPEKGLILAGGTFGDCSQPAFAVQGRAAGVGAVCFTKPFGVVGWYIECAPTVPGTYPNSDDFGAKVRVYGGAGVSGQAFDLFWSYELPPSPDTDTCGPGFF